MYCTEHMIFFRIYDISELKTCNIVLNCPVQSCSLGGVLWQGMPLLQLPTIRSSPKQSDDGLAFILSTQERVRIRPPPSQVFEQAVQLDHLLHCVERSQAIMLHLVK